MAEPAYIISASSIPAQPARILVVDDDRIMLMMLEQTLKKQGYRVVTAASGEEALSLMRSDGENIDSVILDREMPGLSGLEVVDKMKSDHALANIPVIMLTGSGDPEQIKQGIESGVFYYLIKPAGDSILSSVINSALREGRQKKTLIAQIHRQNAALKAVNACTVNVRTLTEAEDTASFLAGCFPEPERVVTGLLELLVNAIEHGNLGINYEEKAKLIAKNQWRKEIERKAEIPAYRDKTAEVSFQRKPEVCILQITDSGKGFDWRKYWQIDPARATASHGRGIARARMISFDKMIYNEAGNQVTVAVRNSPASTFKW